MQEEGVGIAPAASEAAPVRGGMPSNNSGNGIPLPSRQRDTAEATPVSAVDADGYDYAKLNESLNLDKLEKFRNWKSNTDSRISAAENYAREAAKRAADLEAYIENQALQGADDYEKLQIFHQKEKARADALEQELTAIKQEGARLRYIEAVKREFGVDLSDKQFNTPDEAMVIVAKAQRDKAAEMTRQIETLQRKTGAIVAAEAEKVDLGSGAPTGSSAMQRTYDEAMLNLQGELADRILRQAQSEGIKIDRLSFLSQRKRE